MMLRRALRKSGNAALSFGGPWIAEKYIRFVFATTRWQWQNRETLQTIIDEKTPVIFAFWHSRILMMCPLMSQSLIPLRVLVSENRDGELISQVVQRFGHDTVRGSTRNPKKSRDKGGAAALRALLGCTQAGWSVAITPDGPRGPRMKAQSGLSILAAQSGLTVVPLANSTSKGKCLRSWDRFLLAFPFGRGAYVVGPPIPPPASSTPEAIEAHRLEVEGALVEALSCADRMTGQTEGSTGSQA